MKTIQDESTIASYIQNLKIIINDLVLIYHHLSDKKIIVHALNA